MLVLGRHLKSFCLLNSFLHFFAVGLHGSHALEACTISSSGLRMSNPFSLWNCWERSNCLFLHGPALSEHLGGYGIRLEVHVLYPSAPGALDPPEGTDSASEVQVGAPQR